EMLVGWLPFQSDDSMEMIHSHIARIPSTPFELNKSVPKALSNIIMKLMAKTAEERYQSAYGLKADLEECKRQWTANGMIQEFTLGTKDFSSHFQIPQKLYGRQAETEELLLAFDRVSNGATELMLVKGYSGIGKSALVNETHRPITQKRGYFI